MLRAGVDAYIFHVEDNLAAVGAQLVDEVSRSDQVMFSVVTVMLVPKSPCSRPLSHPYRAVRPTS